jgi:GntR family phosphonate transport system transcriptional regulator
VEPPQYIQLAHLLERAIRDEAQETGARLPPDGVLARRYGVNRHTVARALQHLQGKGVVSRVRGHGTFVSGDRLEYRLAADMSFSNSVARMGLRNSQRILAVDRGDADEQLAAELRVPAGAPIITLERVRYAGPVPLALLRKHYPEDLFPGILEQFQKRFLSVRALMRHYFDVEVVRARSLIEVRPADPYTAEHLRVPLDSPLLMIHSLDTLPDGTPAECGVAFFRGDATRLQVSIHEP